MYSPEHTPSSPNQMPLPAPETLVAGAPHTEAIQQISQAYNKATDEAAKSRSLQGVVLENYYLSLADTLVSELLTPEAQQDAEIISIGAAGYLLLARHLNADDQPAYSKIDGLQRVVEFDDTDALVNDPSLTVAKKNELQQAIDVVKEKANKEFWSLDDDDRNWYERITNAPDVTPYSDSSPAPKQAKEYPVFMKRSKVEYDQPEPMPPSLTPREQYEHSKKASDTYITNIAPPPYMRLTRKVSNRVEKAQDKSKDKNGILHRVKNNRFVSPPRHVDPNNPTPTQIAEKADQRREKRLTAEELTRLRDEFSVDNVITNKRAQPESIKVVFAHAKMHALNALAFDDEYRLEKAHRAQKRAAYLGDLGVRNMYQQAEFDRLEDDVRNYNEKLNERTDRVTDSAKGIGHIVLMSELLASGRYSRPTNRTR